DIFKKQTNNNEKILLLAEGEGRNAIYLAKLGYDITTYDMSQVGINKQYQLASEARVDIDANYGDITKPKLTPQSSFDYSINIFGHVPNEGKQEMFNNLVQSLVVGGYSYFEFYLNHLPIKIHQLEQHEIYRNECIKHTGTGSIIQGRVEKI